MGSGTAIIITVHPYFPTYIDFVLLPDLQSQGQNTKVSRQMITNKSSHTQGTIAELLKLVTCKEYLHAAPPILTCSQALCTGQHVFSAVTLTPFEECLPSSLPTPEPDTIK